MASSKGDAPKVALGPSSTSVPLSKSLGADYVMNEVRKGAGVGASTTSYFNKMNEYARLFSDLSEKKEQAWSVATDLKGLPVHYIKSEDPDGNSYSISVRVEGLVVTPEGKVDPNSSSQTINGVTYQGIRSVVVTVGYNDYHFAKSFQWLGIMTGLGVALKLLSPLIMTCLRAICTGIARALGVVAEAGVEAGHSSSRSLERG